MDWFRAYHGMLTDAKLDRIKRKVGCSRGLVVAAWLAVLEAASENDERGNIGDLDEGDIAYKADIKPALAKSILQAILDAGMVLPDGTVSAWSKRQRVSDDVKVRVSEHRARKSKPLKNNDTDPSGNVTETYRSETESEQNRDSSLRSESVAPAASQPDAKPKPPKARAASRGTRLPDGWTPGPDGIAYAVSVGLTPEQASDQLERLHRWAKNAQGAKGLKFDWFAFWQNWVRRAADDLASRPTNVRGPPPQPEKGVMAAGRRALERVNGIGSGRHDHPGADEAPPLGLPFHGQGPSGRRH